MKTSSLCADVLREILVSHKLVVSASLIAELKNILHTKIGIPQEIVFHFVEVLTQDSIFSENTKLKNIDINDEDDILIFSSALYGNAELFVTGDKELLEIGTIKSMRILSPRKFWETLRTQPPDEH